MEGVSDLSRERLHFGEKGFPCEVNDVILYIFSLHYCTAICSGQLTLFTSRANH